MNETAAPSGLLRQLRRPVILKQLAEVVALVVTAAIIVSMINGGYSTPAQVQLRPYDGVTLYRGLFFGTGPVVSKLPTLSKVAPYFPAEYKNLEGPITNYIKKKDPAYFDKFADDIQSGDRVRVAAAIKRTNQIQKEALIEVTKNSRTPIASQVRRIATTRVPAGEPEPENDANVAVEVVVWVALFVAIVVWLVAEKTPPTELKGLRFEQYVNEITTSLPKNQRPTVREARP